MVRAMTEQATTPAAAPAAPVPQVNTSELYAKANKLNGKLASGVDAGAIREGKQLAGEMIGYVRAKLGAEFDDFVHRVTLSEEYSLTESRQVAKTEKELKSFYLRAASLLEAADEAETRAKRQGR